MHIIAPFMSCVVNMPLTADQPSELDQAIAEGYVEIYVITSEGIIKHHKLRGNNRYVRVKVESIPGYEAPKLAQTISFLPAGKIPKVLFDQIVAFFYGVIKANGEKALEAMAHILWNAERGYHIGIPPQQISAASVSYDWAYLPAGTSVVCDIHSHNYMNAFFSGTDNRDDGANISFSGVVGQMNSITPMTVWRFNYQDRKFEAKFEDIFDVAQVEVPQDWIEQVKVSTMVRTFPNNNFVGQGKADHLKPYQFKKTNPQAEGLVNGNRAGPHIRPQTRFEEIDDGIFGGRNPLDLWGEGAGFGDLLGDHADARLARVIEDPMEGQSLGKTFGGLAKSNERDVTLETKASSPTTGEGFDQSSWIGHDRYDELVINHGEAVADAFCLTDDCMSVLNGKDELLEELVFDMFELSSEEGQANMFKQIYTRLPRSVQDKLATSGF